MTNKKSSDELVSNRQARHNFEILETYEAGIALQGTEIKSLRDGGGHLQDNYVAISAGEVWLKQASIAPYKYGNIHNHEDRRQRKLLLHKQEIRKLKRLSEEKGHTLIALSLYLKKGRVKVLLAVCRGKKIHDKRESLKKETQMRDIQQALKHS
jgi:SsrA-binding protein